MRDFKSENKAAADAAKTPPPNTSVANIAGVRPSTEECPPSPKRDEIVNEDLKRDPS